MTQVARRLSSLLTQHERLRIDQPESIDDDFALDGLDGVDDNGDGARSELLEGLLGVDVDGREPAAEARVGMVPADDCLRSAPASC